MVNSLSSFGPITRLLDLKTVMGGHWAWFDVYGEQLLALFQRLEIAPKKPKPPKARAPQDAKRPQNEITDEKEGRNKRRRIESSQNTDPTPVKPRENPRQPNSTPSRPSNTYPYPYPHQLPQTPLAHNPYAALATASTSTRTPFTPHPQSQTSYAHIHYGYPMFHPFSTPSSSYQTPSRFPNPYPYQHSPLPPLPPLPPPPPPST